jgi:hypothetical protein
MKHSDESFFKRQEGNGCGDAVQLHERSNALKGKPHEWNWHETRPEDTGWMKASRG